MPNDQGAGRNSTAARTVGRWLRRRRPSNCPTCGQGVASERRQLQCGEAVTDDPARYGQWERGAKDLTRPEYLRATTMWAIPASQVQALARTVAAGGDAEAVVTARVDQIAALDRERAERRRWAQDPATGLWHLAT